MANHFSPIPRMRQGFRNSELPDVPPASFRKFFSRYTEKALNILWKEFQAWNRSMERENYELFDQMRQNRLRQADEDMEKLGNPFHNAKKGEEYSCSFKMPNSIKKCAIKYLNLADLDYTVTGGPSITISVFGKPQTAGEHTLTIVYTATEQGPEIRKRDYTLQINPDPRELWRNIPCDPEMEYYKPETDGAEIDENGARLVAASRRGRSHAHNGTARDDDFAISVNNGWNILIVADGAGSAPWSRKGSQLACQRAMEICREKCGPASELDEFFTENAASLSLDASVLPRARKLVYSVLPNATFEAYSTIVQEARNLEREPKSYATTLLACMAKKFPSGWVILSFQVGDGAMAALTNGINGFSAELLAEPDEGEYGGQTRFITMKDIFEPNELMRRIRVNTVSDLEAILIMTDGVSDAWFSTLANLQNPKYWQKIWSELKPALNSGYPVDNMLEWLNFWSQGNHDDRTIAVLYPAGE